MHRTAIHTHQTAMREFAFQCQGTLIHKAEVRTKLLDGADHAVPVICMDLELDNELHTPMHVERPYGPNEHSKAEADAKALKRGTHVTVVAPAFDMRLVARNASQVIPLTPPPAAPAAPTPNQQEPELWQQ